MELLPVEAKQDERHARAGVLAASTRRNSKDSGCQHDRTAGSRDASWNKYVSNHFNSHRNVESGRLIAMANNGAQDIDLTFTSLYTNKSTSLSSLAAARYFAEGRIP
jgi:hypothetical protein